MQKILLIRFSALGDVAMLVPIVQRCAEQHPEVSLTVLTRQRFTTLFIDMPSNVTLFGADLTGYHKGRGGLEVLLKDIDYRSFDVVVDMHSVLRSWYLRLRFPWHVKKTTLRKGHIPRWLFLHKVIHKPLKSIIQRYIDTLERVNLPITLQPIPPIITPQNAIGIAPFAAFPTKTYPVDKMEEVVRTLSTKMQIYLFGGGEVEKCVLESWEKKYPNVISLVGKHSLSEEIAIIRTLRLMVTMDSSNMHLASLVGTRVLSIWGATHPDMGFLGYGQKGSDCIQKTLPCRPCSTFGGKTCKKGTYECLNIPPQTIIQRIEDALGE